MRHYHYSYLSSAFFIISGTASICFYKILPTSLVDVAYRGQGFEIKTTSVGVFFIIVGLLLFIFGLLEHRKESTKDKEAKGYDYLISKYQQLLDYHISSGTSISVTKEEEQK